MRRVPIPQSLNDLQSFKARGLERGPIPQIFTLFSGVFSILNNNEAVELLKSFAIRHGLPQTDMALFDIKCPYCGKSDRIRTLENPEELKNGIDPDDLLQYSEIWMNLAPSGGSLGVCKFCQNPLELIERESRAEALYR